MIEQLQKDGFVILENLADWKILPFVQKQVEKAISLSTIKQGNSFMGGRTVRFGRLIQSIPASHSMIQDSTVLHYARSILQEYAPTIQLHFTGVMHLTEGELAQALHRDITPFVNPSPPIVLAAMWALSDFTKANGATVLAPGSHLWDESRAPKKSELHVAEMKMGSCLLYLGNLIHGAGECKRGTRTGMNVQYAVSWLRQEENQYLAVSRSYANYLDDDLLRLMGYDLAARHWGYVDQEHPLDYFRRREIVGNLAPTEYGFKGRVSQMRVAVGPKCGVDYYEASEE